MPEVGIALIDLDAAEPPAATGAAAPPAEAATTTAAAPGPLRTRQASPKLR